jgi:transcriptional regulator with XRE-family HTH domain
MMAELRMKKGLTQDALAGLAGCSVQTIRAIEGGRQKGIAPDLAGYLALNLAVSWDDLYQIVDNQKGDRNQCQSDKQS